jgi:hypothetical protein
MPRTTPLRNSLFFIRHSPLPPVTASKVIHSPFSRMPNPPPKFWHPWHPSVFSAARPLIIGPFLASLTTLASLIFSPAPHRRRGASTKTQADGPPGRTLRLVWRAKPTLPLPTSRLSRSFALPRRLVAVSLYYFVNILEKLVMPTKFSFSRHYARNLQIASHFITLSPRSPSVAAPGRAVSPCYFLPPVTPAARASPGAPVSAPSS